MIEERVDKRRLLTIKQEQKIVKRYQNFLISSGTLASEFNCSDATIRATLERYGVRRRNRGTRVWSEEDKERLSERVKRDWVEKRDIYLACVRKVSWKPDDRIIEVRLTIDARRKLTPLVIGRDKKCVRCGSTKKLHIHHIKSIQERPDLAIEPNNCETLCNRCHATEEANRRWQRRKEQK